MATMSLVEHSTIAAQSGTQEPLLLQALNGVPVHRPPVWMMRQAGRYMKVYQDLCKKHPTFRERSENTDLAVEVSLQPWRAFKPDGVILFSDILTPLTGMNIPFDIDTGRGPIIHDPIRTMEQVNQVTRLEAEEATPYVGEALRALRAEVGNEAAVLGFVGAPFTLASYIVEGGSSKNYTHIKRLAFTQPAVLHALLSKLADNVADYIRYQADAGAQVVQIFDSWASQLSPQDFEVFSAPYIKQIIADVRKTHPQLKLILYISGSGGLLERMAACQPDIMSIDQHVDLRDAIARIGPDFAVQGNMDPGVLFGSRDVIEQRILDTVRAAQGTRHVMNLGHGVLVGTPEDSVAHFFEVARTVHERL
ncbi:uroporphyrinogen-iii decarboxylase [Coccomyxa subellipsoidea C-169]|uniref:Uroporphyrinogen decarboxylase n=1 Tax=Coccomyxa subellipsoidea (strain C-169) TaxID=574566 RepID=I0YW87_COCSC|nr:uroporphyrinogen-iii decarboxylase [Coccomyxa subellipsoidea C-169]EIE22656.1 uroporphyrinogen-iii decarboxylase [Coccomyxa subellipsoidea C-169]|eukprot:XP_005647200.1 uroporphyrinogen-iii decarboxylase [Coccomyxa subellipsoidea C-169]